MLFFQESEKLENIPNSFLHLMYSTELEFLGGQLEIIYVRVVFPPADKTEKDKAFQNPNNFTYYQFPDKIHRFQH